jgi:hypothetical protein
MDGHNMPSILHRPLLITLTVHISAAIRQRVQLMKISLESWFTSPMVSIVYGVLPQVIAMMFSN